MSNYAKVAKFPLFGKDGNYAKLAKLPEAACFWVSGNYAILISPALGQQLLCCPKRGTYVPLFGEGMGRRGFAPAPL